MPGIDGFEVCRRLKSDAATEDIPVIFLSAMGDTEDKVRGLQLGAVDYVSKPFQPEEVKARVDTHLTIHRLRREVQNQRDQLEHELEVVSEVQRGLLPKHLPVIEGFHLAVHYEKAGSPEAIITILLKCRITSGGLWSPMPKATARLRPF